MLLNNTRPHQFWIQIGCKFWKTSMAFCRTTSTPHQYLVVNLLNVVEPLGYTIFESSMEGSNTYYSWRDASLFRNTELYNYSASNIVLIFEVSSISKKKKLELGQVNDDEGKLDVNRWKKRSIFHFHAFLGPPSRCEQGYCAVGASECHYEARLSVLFETLVGTNTTLTLYPNDLNYRSNFASVINDQKYLKFYTSIHRWSGHQLMINNNHSTKTSIISRQAGERNLVADFGLCSFHNSGRPDNDAGGNKILDHLPKQKRIFCCNQGYHSQD